MATPWPSPVDPRRSRANKLSNTRLLATPWLFSNNSPACSNMRFLLVTSRSRRMFDGGKSFAIRFIEETLRLACSVLPDTVQRPKRRGILHYRPGSLLRRGPDQRDFLMLTDGICSDSLYLAIVRRATTIPCWPRISEILLSERGLLASSAATNCLISARIAVAEHAPPVSVATWLPKKYLSSKIPRGVNMNFWVVTRETVDSCKPRVFAISRSTSGRIPTSPCSKKWRWRSTIACDTRRIVSNRCCTFLISQRASWS